MNSEIKEKIKRKKAEHADVRIGKNGLTEGQINEIRRRLEDHDVVKIKIGIEVEDRRAFARQVAEAVGAKLIEVRGKTFILAKDVRKGRDKGDRSSSREGESQDHS